jgi:polar amino acid transport system substrate-binding protein
MRPPPPCVAWHRQRVHDGQDADRGRADPCHRRPGVLPVRPRRRARVGRGFRGRRGRRRRRELGFSPENVQWTRVGFNEAIAPGAKDFDFNLQQFSITAERAEVVSSPTRTTRATRRSWPSRDRRRGRDDARRSHRLKFGAQVGTTSLDFITDVIQPSQEPFVYDDNTAAKAALEANQIDAIVLDLPTAFYVSAVEIEAQRRRPVPGRGRRTTDDFGMVFELDNPLVECVNEALADAARVGRARRDHQRVDVGLHRRPGDRGRVT